MDNMMDSSCCKHLFIKQLSQFETDSTTKEFIQKAAKNEEKLIYMNYDKKKYLL